MGRVRRSTTGCGRVPSEVTLRWSWTNSPNIFTNGDVFLIRGPGFVQQVYEQLLAVQISGVPFNVFTGKRAYTNMMMTSLQVLTEEATENALACVAICQEVIIVETAMTQGAPQNAQASPEQTSPTASNGTTQATPTAKAYDGSVNSSPGNINPLPEPLVPPNVEANPNVTDPLTGQGFTQLRQGPPLISGPLTPSPSGFPGSQPGAIPF